MGNPIILQGLAVLLILFFFVLTYFFTKTWRAFHVIMVFCVFAMTVTLAIYAAFVAKTQREWRTKHTTLTAELERLEQEGQKLEHGDLSKVTAWDRIQYLDREDDSLRSVRGRLARFLFDQGRVWRGCTPQLANNTITINTVPADVPADQARPNRIEPNTVLYIFQEKQIADGSTAAYYYLGEYRVTAATPSQVTVIPLQPIRQDQATLMQQQATWALYEMMPIDSHYVFADTEPDETHLFGVVDENRFTTELMPLAPGMTQEQYQALVQDILRDGTAADEGNDPQDRIWYEVQFLKAATVDVDSGDTRGVLTSDYFDRSGRAVVQRLRRGDLENPQAAEFDKDDTAIFDKETTDRLVAEGTVSKVKPVYLRKLNDYEFEFRQILHRTERLNQDIAVQQRDTAQITKSFEDARQQIIYRQAEKQKLEQDKAQFTKEQQVVTSYLALLTSNHQTLTKKLSELYQVTHALARELAEIEEKVTTEIDRRTADATAALAK